MKKFKEAIKSIISDKVLEVRFWIYFGFFAFIMLLISLTVVYKLPDLVSSSPIDLNEKYSYAAELLNLVFGVPTALAGSFVAILIAKLALDITRRQETLETIQFVNPKLEYVASKFYDLGSSLNKVYNRSTLLYRLYGDYNQLTNEKREDVVVNESGEKIIDKTVQYSHENILETRNLLENSLNELYLNLEKLLKDDLSLAIFNGKWSSDENIFSNRLKSSSFLSNIFMRTSSPDNIYNVIHYIEDCKLRQRKSVRVLAIPNREHDFIDPILLVSELFYIDKQMLLVSGSQNLMCFYFSLIFMAISECIPSNEEIIDVFLEKHTISDHKILFNRKIVEKASLALNPKNILSNRIVSVISNAKKDISTISTKAWNS